MKNTTPEIVIMGIDPGLRYTGYAIARKNKAKLAVFDYGCLRLRQQEGVSERIKKFYDFANEKILSNGITHLVLETPFLGKNAQSFLKLGYLRGVLNLLAAQHALVIAEYSPREIKQAVTGYGGASKEQVARMLQQLFPSLSQTAASYQQDITDAIAICLCGAWGLK